MRQLKILILDAIVTAALWMFTWIIVSYAYYVTKTVPVHYGTQYYRECFTCVLVAGLTIALLAAIDLNIKNFQERFRYYSSL